MSTLKQAIASGDTNEICSHFARIANTVWKRRFSASRIMEREDAVQQAILDCWRRLADFDPERGLPSTYFFRVCYSAMNTLWKFNTRQKRGPHTINMGEHAEQFDGPDDAPSPLDAAILSEECDLVEELMERLKPREQLVIRLRYWRKRTLAQIGKQIGVSPERVRQIEKRALEKMR